MSTMGASKAHRQVKRSKLSTKRQGQPVLRASRCLGKRAYDSRTQARLALRLGNPDGDLRPYKCDLCSHWHLGHPPQEATA